MARTEYILQFEDLGNRAPGIFGKKDLVLTNDASTTAVVRVAGLAIGRLRNKSGGAVTVTFYEAESKDGQALDLYDEDNGQVQSKSVANNGSIQLPTAIAGIDYLIIKGDAASISGISIILFR